MQQAGRGEEGDRFVSCGLRALPGGSAGAGPIHSPHPAPSCPHSSATQIGTPPPVWDPRKVRNATEHPGRCQGSCGGHPPDGMEGGFWDQTLATSRAGSGLFCSPPKCPDQPWLLPAGKAEVEELKPVQDPALAPLGSLPGNCQ